MRIPPFLTPAAFILIFQQQQLAFAVSKFNPNSYQKQIATCKAINRPENHTTLVDIQLRASFAPCENVPWLIFGWYADYVDINPEAETTLIMAHGWPSLWSTWSNQIQEFNVRY